MELVNVRLTGRGSASQAGAAHGRRRPPSPDPRGRARWARRGCAPGGAWHAARRSTSAACCCPASLAGPALVVQEDATTVSCRAGARGGPVAESGVRGWIMISEAW